MSISSSARTYFHSPNFESPSSMGGIGNPHIHSIGVLYTGTTGNDSQTGTSGDDGFDYSQGGNDTLNGLGGADEFHFGATFDYQDQVDGGDGYDTLFLDGDYGGSASQWSPTTLVNVERIVLATGNDYILYLNDATVGAGQTLFIDASALNSPNDLFLDAEFVTGGGSFLVHGGAGPDTILTGGGTDHIFGNGGNDLVFFNTHFTADDQVDGGDGFDTVAMTVATSQTLILTPTTMRNVESLVASAAANAGVVQLALTTVDDTVLSGDTLTVSHIVRPSSALELHFDGSAETNGHFDLTGGPGDDILIGGARSDIFHFEDGGIDAGVGGGGKDTMFAGAGLDPADVFQGGGGFDTLDLSGDYSAGVTFQSTTITSIEKIVVHAGNDYLLALDPQNVTGMLTIDGSSLGAHDTLTIYGAAIDQGKLAITGGGGADFLIGGSRNDQFIGGNGKDTLSGNDGDDVLNGGGAGDSLFGANGADALVGGGGHDVFHYLDVTESTGIGHDKITGFNATVDHFALDVRVDAIDAEVTGGRLRGPSFDSDLASAIGPGDLAEHHAVLFTPSAGAFAGQTFLIVDANATPGYQAGEDYVFALSSAVHLNGLDPGDFI